jgi:hypothetical protein
MALIKTTRSAHTHRQISAAGTASTTAPANDPADVDALPLNADQTTAQKSQNRLAAQATERPSPIATSAGGHSLAKRDLIVTEVDADALTLIFDLAHSCDQNLLCLITRTSTQPL